jgi:HK97 family phage prohead protease
MDEKRIEKRSVRGLELRTNGEGEPRHIVGHAAVFNSLSEEIFGFREVIMPTAFDRALSEKHDVRALVEHLPLLLLGRTKSGTLKLSVDDIGLHADINPPDTAAAQDAMTSIERGDIDGMSFAFIPMTTQWRTEEGVDIREIHDLDLVDVSVVAFPAYVETDVELNALGVAQLEAHGYQAVVEHRFMLAGRLAECAARKAALSDDEAKRIGELTSRVPLSIRERELALAELRGLWPTLR